MIKIDDVLIDRYHILRQLGQGGMGTVYLAKDQVLDKFVAIKALLPELCTDLHAQEELKREVLHAQELSHEYICAVRQFEPSTDQPFIVMEYVDGNTLTEYILRQPDGRFSDLTFRKLAEQILKAVRKSHEAGIIHRDLKSGNIMVTTTGSIRIMDFGIAASLKETDVHAIETSIPLSQPYASPEHIKGEPPSESMDIYSIGCVFYEMLSGRPPFVGGDLLQQHITKTPAEIPNVCHELNALVLSCLRKDKTKRPQTIEQVQRGLDGYKTVRIRSKPLRKKESRTRVYAICAAALLALVVLSLIFGKRLFFGRTSTSQSTPQLVAPLKSTTLHDEPTSPPIDTPIKKTPQKRKEMPVEQGPAVPRKLRPDPEAVVRAALSQCKLLMDDGRYDEAERIAQSTLSTISGDARLEDAIKSARRAKAAENRVGGK